MRITITTKWLRVTITTKNEKTAKAGTNGGFNKTKKG